MRLIEQGLCFTVATARTYATVNSIMKDVQSHLSYDFDEWSHDLRSGEVKAVFMRKLLKEILWNIF